MPNKLGDILKKAFKDAGVDLPTRKDSTRKNSSSPGSHEHPQNFERKNRRNRKNHKNRRTNTVAEQPRKAEIFTSHSVYSLDKQSPRKEATSPDCPAYTISLKQTSCVTLKLPCGIRTISMAPVKSNGRITTLHRNPNGYPDYELTLGFDFGTSSTKIVIGDPQQNKAFAVPFFNLLGIDRYLLPGRLFFDTEYSLVQGEKSFRDLKLALLESSDDLHSEHAVAFIALAIRHARGWLFDNYELLYRDKHILWNFAIGVPSTDLDGKDGFGDTLMRLAMAAWISSTEAEAIDTKSIQRSISRADAEIREGPSDPNLPEILVHPEVAAQIYGFVSSKDTYDPKGQNLYLLVDIGAGTIDTCLFHVTRDTGNQWSFTTFTRTVEFNGAINLHRSRLEWWIAALSDTNVSRLDLADSLKNALLSLDCTTHVPPLFENYVTDSSMQWIRPDEDPDRQFMSKRVRPQILERTYIEAWGEGHLEQSDIAGVPAFLCGGGMRMPFYMNLLTILDRREKNASWVRAKPRLMTVPDRLEASGLPTQDYDRLSVAYGLSLMRAGAYAQSPGGPTPKGSGDIPQRGTYISKEMM